MKSNRSSLGLCEKRGEERGSFDSSSVKLSKGGESREEREGEMLFMREDLLMRTRNLVKGMAIPTPNWLKAMKE